MIEFEIFFSLFGLICVIIIFSIFITRSSYFKEVLDGRLTLKNQTVLALAFGILSIYGTAGGIEFMGAIINVRDLGPMAGGIFCGPVVGIGSGLIGGAFRLMQGGVTAIPCTIATVLSGIFGSAVYLFMGRKFVGIKIAVLFAFLMESFHMVLAYLMVEPRELAYEIVSITSAPLILANVIGMFIFAYLLSNVINERKTRRERDAYESELNRKKAELEIAAEIQRDFLPKNIPEINGFDLFAKTHPAKEVGGDFYDVIPLGLGKTGLVIADVSGKSVPAALFMALSRTIVRASAGWHTTVTKAIEEANSLISSESDSGMFVTLFYSIIDEKSRVLSYTNAGHNPPFVFLNSDGRFETLPPTGIALGVMEDMTYKSGEIRLMTGDCVVFYTDGVTEAINSTEEAYGEERLKRTILNNHSKSAEEISDAILWDVNLFCGSEPQFDDITVMVLKGV
ncbi:SpoIIE family protein phosphatase [Methanoplanus sp. FWC-SCC4]|uniref:SpoIIE family protein phosphatase n=1 Tax=Methanochimaera problematica TaxID=2609417 RepID=A0AA97I4I3_9EURY|nr:SpoIIE family protein phosphatase [Methanoplanus sp. FWC-SCC4]WOF16381.1 SpoIIE family protein phosphatase [Methanoplanus sp. FWC-SCC4]